MGQGLCVLIVPTALIFARLPVHDENSCEFQSCVSAGSLAVVWHAPRINPRQEKPKISYETCCLCVEKEDFVWFFGQLSLPRQFPCLRRISAPADVRAPQFDIMVGY